MPNKPVRLVRWQLTFIYLAVVLSFIVGLWALHDQIRAEKRGRTDRIAVTQQIANDSCKSRHLLAVAVIKQGAVIHNAEARAIAQAVALERQIDAGKAPDPYPAGTLAKAIANARRLVADLADAEKLAAIADCRSTPVIPNP